MHSVPYDSTFRMILTSKVGQTDLVIGFWSSEFVSRTVYARLQVSVCSDYDLLLFGYYPDTHSALITLNEKLN